MHALKSLLVFLMSKQTKEALHSTKPLYLHLIGILINRSPRLLLLLLDPSALEP